MPLVARWPGKIKAGTTSDHPSAFWDVMPTIAEVAGIEAPSGIDGVSFAPTLLGQTDRQKKHDYLYWEFPSYGGQQVVRVGDWKGVRQGLQRKNNPNRLKVELYNLKTDPGEENDVAAKHPDLIAKIERVMRDARVPSKLFPVPVLDEE